MNNFSSKLRRLSFKEWSFKLDAPLLDAMKSVRLKFAKLRNLSELCLCENDLVCYIFEVICQLTQLRALDLSQTLTFDDFRVKKLCCQA